MQIRKEEYNTKIDIMLLFLQLKFLNTFYQGGLHMAQHEDHEDVDICKRMRREIGSGSNIDKITVECSYAVEKNSHLLEDPRNSFARKNCLPLPGKAIEM